MTEQKTRHKVLWIGLAALVFVLVLVAAAVLKPGYEPPREAAPQSVPQSETTAEPAPQSEPKGEESEQEVSEMPDLSRRLEGDPLALGDVDAPVVMLEFADFRCPYCGVFAREALPEIVEDYVDAGLLRIEWWDAPIFGGESFDAAVAARAAGEQGMFWEYYDALFSYEGSDHQDLPKERLLEIAEEIGIPDMAEFEADLDNPELSEAVGTDFGLAQSIGAYSTPAFIIGTTPIMGAQPIHVFHEAIQEELEKAGAA